MDNEKAARYLEEIVNLYSVSGFKMCLMFGTLLGCIRENNFIENDWDIDLYAVPAIYNFSEMQIKFNLLRSKLIERKYSLHGGTGLFTSVKKDDVIIDICMGCFLEDKFIINSDIFIDIYPSEFFLDMETRSFAGGTYYVPNNPEGFLLHYYGPDWNTAIPVDVYEKKLTVNRTWKDGR